MPLKMAFVAGKSTKRWSDLSKRQPIRYITRTMIDNAPHILWSKSSCQNPFSYTLTVKKEVLINSINLISNVKPYSAVGSGELFQSQIIKKCRNFNIKCGTSFRGRYFNLPVSWGVIPVVIGFAEILCYGKIILRQAMIKVCYHHCDWFGDTSPQ